MIAHDRVGGKFTLIGAAVVGYEFDEGLPRALLLQGHLVFSGGESVVDVVPGLAGVVEEAGHAAAADRSICHDCTGRFEKR